MQWIHLLETRTSTPAAQFRPTFRDTFVASRADTRQEAQ